MSDKDSDSQVNRKEILGALGTEKTERRGFLKGALYSAGVGLTTLLGFGGSAQGQNDGQLSGEAARQEMERLEKVENEYKNAEAVKQAVENHSGELLNALENRSLLSSASVSELPLQVLSGQEYLEADEGVHVGAVRVDGEPTAHLSITKQLAVGKLVLFVQPHIGRSYGTIRADNKITFLTSDGATTQEQVAPQSCPRSVCYCNYTTCSCGEWPQKRELFCPDTCFDDNCAWGNYLGCCEETCDSLNCYPNGCSYAC